MAEDSAPAQEQGPATGERTGDAAAAAATAAAAPATAAATAAAAAAAAAANEPAAVCAEPKVFVGGLRFDATQEEVRAHFSRHGPLRHAVILKHLDTGKSRGSAMVLFERWADAEAAVAAEHGAQTHLTAPRQAVVRLADPQRNDQGALVGVRPRKLFVGQVPAGTTEAQLREVFERRGSGGAHGGGGGGSEGAERGERAAGAGAIVDLSIVAPRKPGAMGASKAFGLLGGDGTCVSRLHVALCILSSLTHQPPPATPKKTPTHDYLSE